MSYVRPMSPSQKAVFVSVVIYSTWSHGLGRVGSYLLQYIAFVHQTSPPNRGLSPCHAMTSQRELLYFPSSWHKLVRPRVHVSPLLSFRQFNLLQFRSEWVSLSGNFLESLLPILRRDLPRCIVDGTTLLYFTSLRHPKALLPVLI